MSWKVWPSQRFQYLVGAIMAAIATACFIGAIVLGILPAELRGDLPYDNTKTEYRQRSHDPLIDHAHIERAVGECHGLYTPAEWPEAWPRVAQVRAFAGSPAPTLQPSRPAEQKAPFLAALERAALFQSDRLVSDRYEFEDGIKLKLDRVRQTQIKVLLFSAAASFLIGLKTLLSHNDGSALAFQSFMKGAWLPVSDCGPTRASHCHRVFWRNRFRWRIYRGATLYARVITVRATARPHCGRYSRRPLSLPSR